jgi:hypothetical protein
VALGSMGLPARVPTAVASVPSLTTDVMEALFIIKQHALDLAADANAPLPVDATAYSRMRALLFKNNPAIQEAALNGYITDEEFQAAQHDFAALNEGFASQAASDVGATFTKQVSKTPSCYSPGTDSDYITQVTSVGQIDRMQSAYNQYIDQYLDSNALLDPDELGTQWNRRLDTDFMADPANITPDQFKQIQAKNNAAYGLRESAEMEKLLRAPIQTGDDITPDGAITPDRVNAYAQEMQEMAQHRADMLAQIKAQGGYLIEDSSARANWFKNMALEQKYISRIETATDALRLQNGLDPLPRGSGVNSFPTQSMYDATGQPWDQNGQSIALRGSKRAADNFARAGAATAVADNSLSRANIELATSIAEIAKTNPDFRVSGPATIATLAQQLSPAEKGFLLEQLQRSGGNDFAATTASAMRSTPNVDPAFKSAFKGAVDQSNQQAAQDAGASAPDSTFATWDKALQDSLGIDNDTSKIANISRRQLNDFGQKWLPRMNMALGEIFKAKEIVDAGLDMREYLANLGSAMDGSVPDALAQKYLENAQRIAQGMIAKGTFGAGMTALMEAFPTAGAIVGTFAISFNGTRWVLESTGADKALTIDLAVGAIDLGNQAVEGAGNAVDYLWNGETRAQREARMLLDAYQRAFDRGDILLRDGVSAQDLINAVKLGDIRRIRNELIQDNFCGISKPKPDLQGSPQPAATPTPVLAPAAPAPAPELPPIEPDMYYAFVFSGIGVAIATGAEATTTPGCVWNGGGPRPCPGAGPARIQGIASGPFSDPAEVHADLKTKLVCRNGYWGPQAQFGSGGTGLAAGGWVWLQNNVGTSDCKVVQ